MHGLGNDFIFVATQGLPSDVPINILANQISDRRFGVGCDQFILYTYQQDKTKMYIYNQDGSYAKVCGNASRCLARLLFDQKSETKTILDCDGRMILCHYFNENEIQVNMGQANFHADWMPSDDILWQVAKNFTIDPKEMICVDVGNPHIVIFANLSDQDRPVIGELFQKTNFFKDGVNVNFAKIIDNKIRLKVWERGTGFTLACGSGACATYAAAHKLGFVDEDSEVIFDYGSLKMKFQKDDILMNGRADYVFKGEYIYE
jgi:diaminopimelate epimerase